jgi:ubiquinone/menaquinone biosynthesis C-methylase UbiE
MLDLKETRNQKIRSYYDAYWKSGYEDRESVMRAWWAPAFKCLHSGFGDIAGKRVVEIGAGDGGHARALSALGANVFAVDFSEQSMHRIRASKAPGPGALVPVMADAHNLPFASHCADLVIITNTLMFLNKKAVLEECARVLRPGGRIALLEPLRYPHIIMLARLLEPHYWKTDYRFLSVRELETLGRAFRNVEHREFFLLSSVAAMFARMFPRSGLLLKILSSASRMDQALLQRLGFLRHCCYLTVAFIDPGQSD